MANETFGRDAAMTQVMQATDEQIGQAKLAKMLKHVEVGLAQVEQNGREFEEEEPLRARILAQFPVHDGGLPGVDDRPEVGTMAAFTKAQEGDRAAQKTWEDAASRGLEKTVERRVRRIGLTVHEDRRPHYERVPERYERTSEERRKKLGGSKWRRFIARLRRG